MSDYPPDYPPRQPGPLHEVIVKAVTEYYHKDRLEAQRPPGSRFIDGGLRAAQATDKAIADGKSAREAIMENFSACFIGHNQRQVVIDAVLRACDMSALSAEERKTMNDDAERSDKSLKSTLYDLNKDERARQFQTACFVVGFFVLAMIGVCLLNPIGAKNQRNNNAISPAPVQHSAFQQQNQQLQPGEMWVNGQVWVNDYIRHDGVVVRGHWRTAADGDPSNNWSTSPNVNPYTGKKGTHRK